MVELALPERIVHAVEAAIQGAASDVYQSPLGDKVDGYAVDLARVAGATVLDVLVDVVLKGQLCCGPAPEPQCLKCGPLYGEIGDMELLAQAVRDVPALKAV